MSANINRLTIEKQLPKEVFIKKLQISSTIFDFSDDLKDQKGKAERLEALQELKDMLNEVKYLNMYFIPHIELVFEMIQKCLFRPLIVVKRQKSESSESGKEEDEVYRDPGWTHYQGIYEIFLKIVINDSTDVKNLKMLVNVSFIHNLIELLNSEESREREYIKTILHRLYVKIIPRRKIIRKAMSEVFLAMIHEDKKFNGANELLEILSSLISGFAVPLREEHVSFFKTILVPLHKVHNSQTFHEKLQRCSLLYFGKEPALVSDLLKGLLRYWPFGNSVKEGLFIDELNCVLEFHEVPDLEELVPSIMKRVFLCISGPHLQVSDRSMLFFEKEYFLTMVRNYKHIAFPLFVPIVVELAETHWYKIIQDSFVVIKSALKEIDSSLFEKVLTENEKFDNPHAFMHNCRSREDAERKWAKILKLAKLVEPGITDPVLPYSDNHVVGLNNRNGIQIQSNLLIPPI
jgi:serine/threonine-protein phosphatase 2A regulatory subunit B'